MRKYASFAEFYPHYLSEHAQRTTRRIHFLGSGLGLICLFLLIITGVLIANFIVDIAYVIVDPRTRAGIQGS